MMRRALLLAGLAAGAPPAPRAGRAQQGSWSPSRPVRLILGWPPGGASDAALRIVQPPLQAVLGQSVVIDNRAGAGGNIAAEAVAPAAPDGHTLLSANIGTLAVNPALVRNMPFDPVKDLAPLSLLFNATNILVCPSERPFRSVSDLLAAARAQPGALSYGTGGVGSPGHLSGVLFDHIGRVRTADVPYRGGGPQMTALIAGEHDFAFSPLGTVLPHLETGRVRALGVTTRGRARELPDVPTMIEAGLPDFEVLNWDGVLAPKNTPAPIRARLADALRGVLADPAVVAEFRRRGLDPWPTGEEAFAAQIAADAARSQPLLRAAGIEPS